MNYKLIGITFLLLLTTQLSAQKKETNSSFSLSDLKGSTLYLEFNYDSLKIEGERENDYTKRVVLEKNNKKNGKGDKWLEAWNKEKTAYYEPAFIDGFNAVINKEKVSLGERKIANYVLTIQTDEMERIGLAFVSISIIIRDKVTNKKLDAYEIDKAAYNTTNMLTYLDPVKNIANSYFNAGKILAREINKATRKGK